MKSIDLGEYRGFKLVAYPWELLPDEAVAHAGLQYIEHRLYQVIAIRGPKDAKMFRSVVTADPDAPPDLLRAKEDNALMSIRGWVDRSLDEGVDPEHEDEAKFWSNE